MDPYHRYASLLRVLSHPSRLNLLELLMERELCLTDIQNWIDLDQSALHRHLMLLKQAGLVCDRREGRLVYYQSDKRVASELFQFLDLVEAKKDHSEAAMDEFIRVRLS